MLPVVLPLLGLVGTLLGGLCNLLWLALRVFRIWGYFDSEKLAKEASTVAREAEQMEREAEGQRPQKMRKDAEKAIVTAREEAKKTIAAVIEEAKKTRAAVKEEVEKVRTTMERCLELVASKARAEEMAQAATEEARKEREAKEEAERKWKAGIQPVVTPSPEEVAAVKLRIQYRKDYFYFAVAGISGSGKSSLVSAFCGLRSKDVRAAAVGVTGTTLQMTRYSDANPNNSCVWYDIPGAGTLKCRDWQYFNDQGLYVFDCIIILVDNRFTMTDIAILVNARRFNIPTYIVRSKADQHIRNVMMDMGYDSEGDGEEDVRRRNELYKAARRQFVDGTRKSVKSNLEDANLPDQRVYIVSSSTLLSTVLNKMPEKTIDEVGLLNDLTNEAHMRRAEG